MVPEGGPTGIDYDKLTKKNYPRLDASKQDNYQLPFLIRECAVKLLEFMRVLKEEFDEKGLFTDVGRILSKLLLHSASTSPLSSSANISLFCCMASWHRWRRKIVRAIPCRPVLPGLRMACPLRSKA